VAAAAVARKVERSDRGVGRQAGQQGGHEKGKGSQIIKPTVEEEKAEVSSIIGRGGSPSPAPHTHSEGDRVGGGNGKLFFNVIHAATAQTLMFAQYFV
jgi:hypothetical protein